MMRWNLNSMPLYAAAYLAVFVAAYPNGFRSTLGTQIDLLPPLVVYCALQSKWTTLAGITIFGGYLFDSLSANPLGLTTASLFISGCVIRVNRETILRDQTFAQLVIGFMASLATPVVSLLLLWLLGRPPSHGLRINLATGIDRPPRSSGHTGALRNLLTDQTQTQLSSRPGIELPGGSRNQTEAGLSHVCF